MAQRTAGGEPSCEAVHSGTDLVAALLDPANKKIAELKQESIDETDADMIVRVPAIVISAYTSEEELELARQEGPVAVFQKPVPISQLLAELERLPSRAAR